MFINSNLQKFVDIFIIVYLNDILIFLKWRKNYVMHMSKVLNALKAAELYYQLLKCVFIIQEIEFLNYIISNYNFVINSARITVITN